MFKKRRIKKSDPSSAKRKVINTDLQDDEEVSVMKESVPVTKKFKTADDSGQKKRIREESTETSSYQLVHSKNTAVMETNSEQDTPTKNPLNAIPVNIRTTTITDFQPDVCKDFQQTGYCGYGDTCKFLHIRDETRAKNPVKKEWETVGKSKQVVAQKPGIPFKCVICRQDYIAPVRTECEHIFCKECFTTRYKSHKKPKCFICGKDTSGISHPVSVSELSKLLAVE